MSTPSDSSSEAAPSDEGAVARFKAATTVARERLAALIESSLTKLFDAPLDIRNAHEAMHAINPNETAAVAPGAMRKAAEWGAARAARRIGVKYGSKVAGRAVAPIGVAVEFGLAARDGLRELQVLASFLVGRLRAEGYTIDQELVRRTVLAVYLEPQRRPDLRVPLRRRSLAIAKRWSMNTLPLTGRRQSSLTRQRVDALAGLHLPVLAEDWARVSAIETSLSPLGRVVDARVLDRPGSPRVAPPPPPPPPPPPAG